MYGILKACLSARPLRDTVRAKVSELTGCPGSHTYIYIYTYMDPDISRLIIAGLGMCEAKRGWIILIVPVLG